MSLFEIVVVSIFGAVALTVIICIILNITTANKYKKFYRDIAEGKKLRELRFTKDNLIEQQIYCKNTLRELREVMDELNYCTADFADEIHRHSEFYGIVLTKLKSIRLELYSINKQIQEIISKLPTKYKDALRYDYNISK